MVGIWLAIGWANGVPGPHGFSSIRRLAWVCSRGGWTDFQEKWKCTWPLEAYSELALCHFYHVLLTKAIHKASLDSRSGEIDSAS